MFKKRCNERKPILFSSSLYSSMLETVLTMKWIPKGLPAYYKLVKAKSSQNIPLYYRMILLCKVITYSLRVQMFIA